MKMRKVLVVFGLFALLAAAFAAGAWAQTTADTRAPAIVDAMSDLIVLPHNSQVTIHNLQFINSSL